MILIKLLIAHLIGDFFLQPKGWIEEKQKNKWKSKFLFIHVVIHFLLILLVLWDLSYWPIALLVIASHWVIDVCKLTFQTEMNNTILFLGDQLAHLTVLFVVWLVFWEQDLSPLLSEKSLIVFAGLLVLTSPVAIVMNVLMSRWQKEIKEDDESSLTNGGLYIGILERLLIYLSVLAGYIQIVGFLIAAKSIFRFGDLTRAKDRKLTEYIVVGTLLSFLIALLTGFAVKELLKVF